MVLVRETVTAEWEAWRNIRLHALRDAPDAVALPTRTLST